MKISGRHLEGIARQTHDETGVECPVDAFDLAERLGLSLRPWSKAGGMCVADIIHYPAKASAARQQGTVAHELGHWLLGRAGEDAQDEDAADYLAGALLLPRLPFMRDLIAYDWDMLAIRERHINASWQMLVIRCVQVADAAASVWDAGKLHAAYGAADIEAHRELVLRVLERGEAERGQVSGYPVFTPGFRRVVCVSRG